MNILILSRKRRIYSTARLAHEADKLGHSTTVVDPLKCILYITQRNPKIFSGRKEIPARKIDIVIPRFSTYATSYILSVVRQLDIMKVPILNNHGPVARSRNKLGCLQLLAQNGIKVPETLISRYPRNLQKLISLVGGTPLIMKLLKGTQGTGVILSENPQVVESVLDTIWSLGEDIMLQRFIKETKGSDLRIMVLGGKVVAAMRRHAKEGEFRANIHKGAVGEVVEKLPKEFEKVAVKSANVVGLELAGVDILESKDGPLVIEVNSSPGFQGLEAATGLNIAKMIIDFAAKFAKRARKNGR